MDSIKWIYGYVYINIPTCVYIFIYIHMYIWIQWIDIHRYTVYTFYGLTDHQEQLPHGWRDKSPARQECFPSQRLGPWCWQGYTWHSSSLPPPGTSSGRYKDMYVYNQRYQTRGYRCLHIHRNILLHRCIYVCTYINIYI